MKLKICSLIFLFGSLLSLPSFSQRVISADLTYTYISGETYEFTLNVYRDCSNLSFLQSTYNITYYSKNCSNKSGTFDVNFVKKVKLSAACPAKSSFCDGGDQPGFEKYTYKGLFTLPATCNDWSISWFDCYRTNNITNIQNPGGTCISVEAKLNNKDFHTSSPVFNNDILGFACNGSQNLINLGATAPNGDLLVYSSTTPLTLVPAGVAQTVTYKPGFSASNPFSTGNTFQVNSSTGDIKFTPTVTGDKAVISILVQQYRNGQLVGSVMKDQQIGVFDCVLPTITTSSISATYCAKAPINIQFGGKDPANNKVSLSWNNGIPNGSFVPIGVSSGSYTLNQQAAFTWTPTNADVGKKSFIVTVKNDACPISFPQSISVNFEVVAAPDVALRSDTIVPCLVNFPLTYTYLANGTPPYTYLWSTGETTASVSKPTGSYSLTVSDRNGCKGSDDVNLTSGINADFRISSSTCVGTPLYFQDLSTSSATITSWLWNFGNGITSNSISPTVTYPIEGQYSISLTVRDNNNCTQTIKKPVAICSIPKLTFAKLDSCVKRDVPFTFTASSNVCNLSFLTGDFGDGKGIGGGGSSGYNVSAITSSFSHTYDTTGVPPGNYGTYTVRPIISNWGNCSTTSSLSIKIYPRPTYLSFSPLVTAFNCESPIVTLSGIATTTATGATPPLTYTWSTGATAVNTVTVNGVGLYSLTVTDKLGCNNTLSYQVNNPISSAINITKGYCSIGDSVKFSSLASSSWGIRSLVWNMGDGTIQNGTKAGKIFYQGKDTTFIVRLIATDNSNCIDSSAYAVAKIALPKQKKIYPKDTCYGNSITLPSPENSKVLVIDNLCWNIRNNNFSDTLWYQSRSNDYPYACKMNNSSDVVNYNPTLTFSRPGKNYIRSEVNYNSTCRLTFYDTVNVWNIVKDTVTYNNRCALFPTTFTPVKISGDNPITKRVWNFHYKVPYGIDSLIIKADTMNLTGISFPPLKKHGGWTNQEKTATNYYLTLSTTDSKGCKSDGYLKYFKSELIAKNKFEVKGNCVNEGIQFLNNQPNNLYNNNVYNKEVWNLQDTIIVGSPASIPYRFKVAKQYTFSLTVFNEDDCSATYDTTMSILPKPTANFRSDTVCLSAYSRFTNLSIPASLGDSIISYAWDLGTNGAVASSKNTTYTYPSSGVYTVSLKVVNNTLCKDTVRKQVFVRPKPKADFIVATDNNSQQAGIPINFTDLTSSTDNIVEWDWKFTKKDSQAYFTKTDPLFTFDTIAIFDVRQIVRNNQGCTDTATARVDLNAYLILPTAFSPNGDSQNDQLYLLYKGIKSLKEFKIYNRFGEKVFDGGSNLDAIWDGNQNGQPSPVGSYVYYVVAGTNYGKDIAQRGQLTLIR